MRKLLPALVCLLLLAGVVWAGDVVLVKYEPSAKAVTVKDGAKEAVYKLTDKTTVEFVDKDGNVTKGTLEAAEKVLGNEKFKGRTFAITADKDQLTGLKIRRKK